MTIITAYLRDGRVHRDRAAYEGGDGFCDYRYEINSRGEGSITAVIDGVNYRSLWCWAPEAPKPYGYVSLKKENS